MLNDPYLFNIVDDTLYRRYISKKETRNILCHYNNSPYEGHYKEEDTDAMVLQSGFLHPTILKDAHDHVQRCDNCQRLGSISRRHEIPLQIIFEVEIIKF